MKARTSRILGILILVVLWIAFSITSYYGDGFVIQVCLVATSKLKRGKANTFGIYPILYSTFAVNYQSFERLDECSEEEYEIKFNQAIEQLKNHIV